MRLDLSLIKFLSKALLVNYLKVDLFLFQKIEYRMSEPAVEELINFTSCPTDNSLLGLHKNPCQLHGTSACGYDFNGGLNTAFKSNKCERIKASSGIETILEPFNKNMFGCTNQKEKVPGKLSQRESLESNESLGLLPDLLNDEMTSDLFKTELGFSDEDSEINENPASLVFSPLSDNQFNRISLFLKNISTPLPNFGSDRRCSSTPKISGASQFIANAANIEHYSSPQFLPDEKEEPIAGSCHIKFETDFNLDDFKNVKPLTSTYKTFSPLQLSPILSDLDEETNLKSEANFENKHEAIENTLNVTQIFSHNVKDLHEHEGSIQNVNILNNTFPVKQHSFVVSADAIVPSQCSIRNTMKISQAGLNNHREKEKVKTLDSTFQIPRDDISCNVDCEKTFVIDFNSATDAEVFSKSICKDKMLNETHVLEINSIEFFSKQQEKIENVTFTKDLENDSQTSFERFYSSRGTAFKPLTQILEETLSRSDLKPILEETFSENDLKAMKPILEETFSKHDLKAMKPILEKTFSENDLKAMKPVLEETSKHDFKAKNRILEETFSESDLNQMLAQSKKNFPCVQSRSQLAVNPEAFNVETTVAFSEKVENFLGTNVTQIDNYEIEFASPNSTKALPRNIFPEESGEKTCFHGQNLAESKNDPSKKMPLSVALQSFRDDTFSKEIIEQTDQEMEKSHKSDSTENANSIIEHVSPRVLASTTFNENVGRNVSFLNQIDPTENEYDPANKMSHLGLLQSISNSIFSETNKKSDIIGKFCKFDSIPNESSCELASTLSKVSKSVTFSDGSEVANIRESSVFLDSDDVEKGASNSQTIFSINAAHSLDLNQCDNIHAETNSKANEDCIFPCNVSVETEFCTQSILDDDCPFEILPKSSKSYASTTFSEKSDQLQSDIDSTSNENDLDQLSQNPVKEMTNTTFSKKTEVQIEQIFFPNENNQLEASPNSQREINTTFSGLADKDIKVQPELQISQCDDNSLGETASSNETKFCLKGTLSEKTADKSNSPLKGCSLESKTVVKKGLIKPTKIAYPRKVSEHCNDQSIFVKPLVDKQSTTDFNRTLNLCDNSTDKSLSKTFNRRLTLSCSSESEANKCKSNFKKYLGIPSNLGIKKPESNFQKSRLSTKYSNGHLKDTINAKKNSLPQPDLISCKNPTIVKSAVSSVNAKKPISSRLSLNGKIPLKSLKMKEYGLKSITAPTCTAEKNKVISCPKVIDLPRKEKMSEVTINNADMGNNSKLSSIAANLPRKILSFSTIPNKTCNSKPTVSKQKSAPASTTCKPESLKPLSNMKLPDSITKLKFSSLPKVQSNIKISSDGSKSKNVVIKRPVSANQKLNGFLKNSCIPDGDAVQFMETQISTGHVKQTDDKRENARSMSSMFPSREQTVQSLNPLSIKKTNGRCSFLPAPKTIRDNTKYLNSNDVLAAQESELQKQVSQQASGKLPQLQKIPALRYKK